MKHILSCLFLVLILSPSNGQYEIEDFQVINYSKAFFYGISLQRESLIDKYGTHYYISLGKGRIFDRKIRRWSLNLGYRPDSDSEKNVNSFLSEMEYVRTKMIGKHFRWGAFFKFGSEWYTLTPKVQYIFPETNIRLYLSSGFKLGYRHSFGKTVLLPSLDIYGIDLIGFYANEKNPSLPPSIQVQFGPDVHVLGRIAFTLEIARKF